MASGMECETNIDRWNLLTEYGFDYDYGGSSDDRARSAAMVAEYMCQRALGLKPTPLSAPAFIKHAHIAAVLRYMWNRAHNRNMQAENVAHVVLYHLCEFPELQTALAVEYALDATDYDLGCLFVAHYREHHRLCSYAHVGRGCAYISRTWVCSKEGAAQEHFTLMTHRGDEEYDYTVRPIELSGRATMQRCLHAEVCAVSAECPDAPSLMLE